MLETDTGQVLGVSFRFDIPVTRKPDEGFLTGQNKFPEYEAYIVHKDILSI